MNAPSREYVEENRICCVWSATGPGTVELVDYQKVPR